MSRALVASLLLLAAAAATLPAQAAQHAHVHGTAKLGIAVQDKTVTIALESPLASLIGFEHRPTTPAEQRAVDALRARLKAPGELFAFDAAAACTLTKSDAESIVFEPAPAAPVASSASSTHESDEHGDLDASFEYRCLHPERLSAVDVGLFQAWPKLQRIDVDVATAGGQFKRELRSPQRRVALVR